MAARVRAARAQTHSRSAKITQTDPQPHKESTTKTQTWCPLALARVQLQRAEVSFVLIHSGAHSHVRAWLADRYERLAIALASADIPHLRPQAGLFCWVDLRAWLPTPAEASKRVALSDEDRDGVLLEAERERMLHNRLMHECGPVRAPHAANEGRGQ